MNNLFQFPPAAPATPADANKRTRALILSRITSHVVSVPGRMGKSVDYARLSDADHANTRAVIEALHDFRGHLRSVLDKPSGLYGQRSQSRQTKGDILDGLMEKLRQPHPVVRCRKGEDFTVKQLKALNKIIDDVNALLGGDTIEHVVVP